MIKKKSDISFNIYKRRIFLAHSTFLMNAYLYFVNCLVFIKLTLFV